MKTTLTLLAVLLISQSSFASIKPLGPALSPAITVPQDFALQIDSNLAEQKFDEQAFSVILSCVRKGHKNFKGSGRINCVAVNAFAAPSEEPKPKAKH